MSVTPLLSGLAIVLSTSLLLGCTSSAPSNGPETNATLPPGSAVEAPVFSADPCEMDEDCAAVAECHADRCVRASDAGTKPSEMICTMECRPGTVDCGYNHCGCAASLSGQKLCALLPGPAKP